MRSQDDVTDSFWGPNHPNNGFGNTDDCGVLVLENGLFIWEDRNCLTLEISQHAVAPICQYDEILAPTTAGSTTASSTTAGSTTASSSTAGGSTTTTVTTDSSTTTIQPQTTTISSACSSDWTEFQGYCYQHFIEPTSWMNAEMHCRNVNASMVSIHSVSEKNFLTSFVIGESFWIGAYHSGSYNYFWTDFSEKDFDNFYDDRPGCLYQYNAFGWIGAPDCTTKLGFGCICKKKTM